MRAHFVLYPQASKWDPGQPDEGVLASVKMTCLPRQGEHVQLPLKEGSHSYRVHYVRWYPLDDIALVVVTMH